MQKPYAWAKKLCWIEGALDHSLRRIMHHQFKNSNVLHQFDCYFRLLRNNKGFEMSNATPSITKLQLLKFQTFMAISFLREMENNGQLLVSGVFVIFMETKKQIRSDYLSNSDLVSCEVFTKILLLKT